MQHRRYQHQPSKTSTRKARQPAQRNKLKAKIEARKEPRISSESDYLATTALLSQAYKLRDLAANEYLLGNFGLSTQHAAAAARLSGSYWGRPMSCEAHDYFDLGLAAEAGGQNSLAKDAYFQCLQRQAWPAAYECLTWLYMKEGDLEQAQAYAHKLLESSPDYAGGHLLMSVLAERTGRRDIYEQEQRQVQELLSLPASELSGKLP